MRCFTAVVLPSACVDAINQQVQALDGHWRAASVQVPVWEKLTNLHCTLNFFGEIDEPAVNRLVAAARAEISGNLFPIRLQVGGFGLFPDRGRPEVLWVGVADADNRLRALQATLRAVADRCGIVSAGQQAFRPHVTIGRWRRSATLGSAISAEAFPKFSDFGELPVEHVLLMQSTRSSQGMTYTPIAKFPHSPADSHSPS